MSVCTRRSVRAELERTPVEQETFLHQLRREWAGDSPTRLRRLAALTLRANGWDIADIATALKIDKTCASRLVSSARRQIGNHFEPPAPLEQPLPADACCDGDGWTE